VSSPALAPESHDYLGALAAVSRDLVVTGLGDSTTDWAHLAGPERHLPICGAMGHAMSVALGLAVSRPDVRFIAIEGDGGVLLNLGGLVTLGALAPSNLLVLVLNNGCYASSGGQSTPSAFQELGSIARACGLASASDVSDVPTLLGHHGDFVEGRGPGLLSLRVSPRTAPRFPFSRRPGEIRSTFDRALSAQVEARAR